jgi:hypothetical protein
MFIRRRKEELEGVYQATCLENKPDNSSGLRTGGYFISLEVCMAIKSFYKSKSKSARTRVKGLGGEMAPVTIVKSVGDNSVSSHASPPVFFHPNPSVLPATEVLLMPPPRGSSIYPFIQIPNYNETFVCFRPPQPNNQFTILYW